MSSVFLILWGVDHLVPFRAPLVRAWRWFRAKRGKPVDAAPSADDNKHSRYDMWRDALMLIALGIVDWTYAIVSNAEVTDLQAIVGPRDLTADQIAYIQKGLRAGSRPTHPLHVTICHTGTDRQKAETKAYGERLAETIEGAGWTVVRDYPECGVAAIGLYVRHPPISDADFFKMGRNDGDLAAVSPGFALKGILWGAGLPVEEMTVERGLYTDLVVGRQ